MAELAFDIALLRNGQTLVFDGSIPLDGVTAVMGPSGSGKTTLLRLLAGYERGARGSVRFGERQWAEGRRGLRPEARRVGFVFQEGRLFRHMSVADNIAFGARRRNVAPAAVEGITEGLGLKGLLNRRPATLSGGEARRVALARALASGPEILFLDEPLSALDDEAKAHVLPYLARAVTGSGIPVVYVTHARDEVTRFADRVLLVREGRVAGWGRPPACLSVTIREARGGHVAVELGGAVFELEGHGDPGDARRIAIPERGLLISRDPPGSSGALAVFRSEVSTVMPRPSGPDVGFVVAGEHLTWQLDSAAALARDLPEPGEQVWLSILAAHLR